ncbi:MAG: imidazole glycerol phosphate synthase subunit HisH [Coriobacteriales bacterium]|jgi:glutamine amidotransferase|nr:imidazole glycerol phosphate synthase subunit HisH [Coriobacteriales bacterium]
MAFVVVDYCKGNLRSMQRGLELAGAETLISADPVAIAHAEAIVLPGVGAFADAATFMHESGQMAVIRERIAAQVPFLGVCLGLHLLFERGEEGMDAGHWAEGLGILRGEACRIQSIDAQGLSHKVPHVGWNQVHYRSERSQDLAPLFAGIEDGSNFYFTHSYQGVPSNETDVLAEVTHAQTFPCVVRRGSTFGVQFHPEKSSHKGLAVLRNFVRFAQAGGVGANPCGEGVLT